MAERSSAGVYIEEVPSAIQVVQAVSTSNLGAVGFTPRGPTDEATLVTSYEDFTRIFGGLSPNSFLPLGMAAYFANGGKRAYVVRVVPSDAVAAASCIATRKMDKIQNVGDGTTSPFTEATLSGSVLSFPVKASSVTFAWRGKGTPVATENLCQDDGTTTLVADGVKTEFSGRVKLTSLPTIDQRHFAIDPGSVALTVTFTSGAAPLTITLVVSGRTASGTNAGGSKAILDLKTGRISLDFDAAEIPDNASNIKLTYTPTKATVYATDNGSGQFTGTGVLGAPAGTISYVAGTYSVPMVVAEIAHTNAPIIVEYEYCAFDVNPISKGVWGNDLRIDISGNEDSYVIATASYSSYNVEILLKNSSGAFQVMETFEELVCTDPTSSEYLPDVLNELSDLITVDEPSYHDEGPASLSGVVRSENIGAGSGLAKVVQLSLERGAVAKKTVSITWVQGGVTKTATDDGAGNIIGDVNPTGANSIDYTTGAIDFTTVGVVDVYTLMTASYYSAGEDTTTQTIFTGGSDGTFTTVTYSRGQFTSPVLIPTYQGLYALSKVDELLQICIPDFAGDVTVTGDQLDYAESRRSLPSGGDRFIILTVPYGSSAQEAVDWFKFQLGRYSDYSAVYWPWIKVADPLSSDRPLAIPPIMHIAGIYARTDSTKNVGKSPGGTVDGALKFLVGLETKPSIGDRATIFASKLNSLISTPQTGMAVWGVRTISNQSDWRYVNARRLVMFVENSVYNSTHWVAFENNGPALWTKIKTQLVGWLGALFGDGYFAGTKPTDAFFVTCDQTNNTPVTVDQGVVITDVGVAPNKPAEFVVFRFTLKTL
jgi:phage tail sheath protein FI